MDAKLSAIISNSTAGSMELLTLMNEYLSDNVKDIDSLKDVLTLLQTEFETFSAIKSYLKEIRKFALRNDFPAFENHIRSFREEYNNRYKRLFLNSEPFLKNVKTIITISNSKTLLEVFRLIKNKKKSLRLIVPESRPKEEGKIFAHKLLEAGIKVHLITEAMIASNVEKAEAVVIGADSILSTGNVVNKSGSKLLAIAARYYKKPFYVLATKDKIGKKASYKPELYPPEEIWDYSDPKLNIQNQYFEEIDKKLITRIITD